MPRPPPNDVQFYTVEDLNIGNELTIYARQYKLVNCDEFTRNFLTKLGVQLKAPIQMPMHPYSEHRKMVFWVFLSEIHDCKHHVLNDQNNCDHAVIRLELWPTILYAYWALSCIE